MHIVIRKFCRTFGFMRRLYSFNNLDWMIYNSPFYLTSEGVNNIFYYAVDTNNNQSNTKHEKVILDATPPYVAGRKDYQSIPFQ